jgi:hypothetical protein
MEQKVHRSEGKTSLSICQREFDAPGISKIVVSLVDLGDDPRTKLTDPPQRAFEPTPIEGLGTDAMFHSEHRGTKTATATLRVIEGRYQITIKESVNKKTEVTPRDELACDKDQLVELARSMLPILRG